MIPRNYKIIACGVHDFNNGFTVRKFADRSALNGVARIHQRNGVPIFLQLLFVLRDLVNPQVVAYTAMDIVGMQYDDVFFFCKTGKRKQEQKQKGKNKTNALFQVKHGIILSRVLTS